MGVRPVVDRMNSNATYGPSHIFAGNLCWLLGRGGSLSMPWHSDDDTHLDYMLDGTKFTGHGAGIEIAAEWLVKVVREADAAK